MHGRLEDGRVRCALCFRNCNLADGERGFCLVRMNSGGRIDPLVYSRVAAVHIDPIEKIPLYHFHPGGDALCVGLFGCNFRCPYCINWEIALKGPEEVESVPMKPRDIVEKALDHGVSIICFTYNEPTVNYEYVLDTAKLAQARGLKTTFHTNGLIAQEPLKTLLPFTDAVAVDLKGYSSDFYRRFLAAELNPVLHSLKTIRALGTWLEVVNTMVPTINDDPRSIWEMCSWIRRELGEETPVHFIRFFPTYKLATLPPTPLATLLRARKIALGVGLKYVYIGNVAGHESANTYCSECGRVIVDRTRFPAISIDVRDGRCGFCGHRIPGVW